MDHEECREIDEAALLEYAQERLSESETGRIAAHLEECADCRARAEAVQALASALSNAVDEEALEAVAGKGDEAVRLLRAKDGRRSQRPQTRRLRAARRRRSSAALWLGLAAAAAAVVLAGLVLLDRPEDRAGRSVTAKPEEAAVIPPGQVEGHEAAPGELRTVPPAGPVEEAREEVPRAAPRPERPALAESEPAPIPPIPAGLPEETEPVLAETPEGPTPEPTPAEAETTRPVARLAAVWGSIRYKRKGGTKWFKAAEGLHLSAGDEIDSRSGRARLAVGEDAAVYLNRDAQVSLGESRIQLGEGEVYSDIRGRGEALEIATRDGIVRHLGTKFAVKVSRSGTTVVVEEGRVEVSNEKGKVALEAGWQVSVRKGREPARPRKADTRTVLAWTKGLRGTEPFDLKVSFGPPTAAVPEGRKADCGERFDRKRGYGWRTDFPRRFRLREGGSDLLHRRVVFGGSNTYADVWEVELANGEYLVSVGCGDTAYRQGPNRIVAEGVYLVRDQVAEAGQFIEVKDVPVTVGDGRMTFLIGAAGTERLYPGDMHATDTAWLYVSIRSKP